MSRVICTNDKKLPEGAEVKEGFSYYVEDSFTNNFGQKALMLSGVRNEGITKNGLHWKGYDATRFKQLDKVKEKVEFNVMAN